MGKVMGARWKVTGEDWPRASYHLSPMTCHLREAL